MSRLNNKCDICALRVIFDQDIRRGGAGETENFMKFLHKLQKEKLIGPGHNRAIHVSNTGEGDKSVMCAINSKCFLKDKKKCPGFILNIGLTVSEAVSLHTAKSTDKLTRSIYWMTFLILALTTVAVTVTLRSSMTL